MIYLFLFAVAVGLLFFFGSSAKNEKKQTKKPVKELLFRKRNLFPNSSAQKMFIRLCEALPDMHIHAEVGFLGFIQPKGNNALNGMGRIGQKRIDFLVTTANGEVICGIELDGKSHDNPDAAANDLLKSQIFEIAGIRLVRFRAELLPNGDQIRAAVMGANDGTIRVA